MSSYAHPFITVFDHKMQNTMLADRRLTLNGCMVDATSVNALASADLTCSLYRSSKPVEREQVP